jgi:hypothetical protein
LTIDEHLVALKCGTQKSDCIKKIDSNGSKTDELYHFSDHDFGSVFGSVS